MSDAIVLSPPLADFTRPPPELGQLKAAAQKAALDVHTVDLNLRAFLDLLAPEQLRERVQLAEARISGLAKRPAISFWEQQELLALSAGFADGAKAVEGAGLALETFRTADRFFHREHYTNAVKVVQAALRLLSGLSFPFELSPAGIGAPFGIYSAAAVSRFAAIDPFRGLYDKVLAEAQRSHSKAIVVVVSEPGQFLPAFSLATVVRAAKPEALLVLTGPFVEQWCAGEHEATKKLVLSHFDAVLTMDAEQVLVELLESVKEDKLKPVHGVWFKEGVKTTGRAKAHAPVDVDKIDVPDLSDLALADYPVPDAVISYRASRGRHVSRTGLAFWGLTEKTAEVRRTLPADIVAGHLAVLADKTNARFVQFVGDLMEPSWVDAFAGVATERGLKWRWSVELLLDDAPLTPEMAARWKAAGCTSVVIGLNEHRQRLADVTHVAEALAHAGIAVQTSCMLGWPGETEERARELTNVLRSHHQEIDTFSVVELSREPGARLSCNPAAYGAQAVALIGDELSVFADYPKPIAGSAKERLIGEVERVAVGYQTKRFPFAGSVASAHTLLGFERFGRRVFAQPARPAAGQPTRPLSEGDRIRISESAKLLWLQYQLSVLEEIAKEEVELRDHDLVRRQKDISADKLWGYSQREDLKMRAAGHRTPHILAPGMPPTEITVGLADLLAMATEQFMPISQLVAKAPREMRDPLKRQLATLHIHGAITTEQQQRFEERAADAPRRDQGQQNRGGGHGGGQPGGSGGGQPGGGRRKRRRRRGRGGDTMRMNNGGSPPPM
ncbi:MAG: hypothetical protein IT381_24245 [Deltaproteobacteria bacterium]|nr:hypothetical protein [Deltaproteobacteria bacterium]